MNKDMNDNIKMLTEEEINHINQIKAQKARKKVIIERAKQVSEFKAKKDKNYILKELSRFELQGNIIDQGWFEHLVNESGKVQPNAIFVLSEIVYWYRPTLVFDEDTSAIIGLKSKFKGDMLQKSYSQLSEKFGLSKVQVERACKFLEKKNLIVLDFRKVYTANGRELNNVLYIGLNVEELKKISIIMNNSLDVIEDIKDNVSDEDSEEQVNEEHPIPTAITTVDDPIDKKVDRVSTKKLIGYRQKSGQAINKKVDTYTKITTTENTNTEIISTSINQSNKEKDKNINRNRLIEIDKKILNKGFKSYSDLIYDTFLPKDCYEYPYSDWLDCAKKAIWQMYYYDETSINGRRLGSFDVISKLQNLNNDIVYTAIQNVVEVSKQQMIEYPVAFLKTAIYNEIDEFGARIQATVNYDMNNTFR